MAKRFLRALIAAAIALLFVPLSPTSSNAQAANPSDDASRLYPPPRPASKPKGYWLGAVLTTNSPGWARIFSLRQSSGPLVLRVQPKSPAANAGIAPGDLISEMNGKAVANEEMLSVQIQASRQRAVELKLIHPDGSSAIAQVKLSTRQPEPVAKFLQEVPENPDPGIRLLFAQTSADSALASSVLEELTKDVPGFAQAYVEQASRATDDLRKYRSQTKIRAAVSEIDQAILKAVELDPGSLEVRLTATRVFLDLRQIEQAAAQAAEAVELDGNSPKARDLLGRCLIALGQGQQALPHLHQAVQLNPFNLRYYQGLNLAYATLGLSDSAKKTAKATEGLRENPSNSGSADEDNRADAVGLALGVVVLVGALAPLVFRSKRSKGDAGAFADSGAKEATRLSPIAETLVGVGAWTALIPYIGRALGLAPDTPFILAEKTNPQMVDLVEHVFPGLAVFGLAAWATYYLFTHPDASDQRILRLVPAGCFLAGFWVIASHVRLIQFSLGGTVRWEATIFHTSTGPVLLILAGWLYFLMAKRGAPGQPGARAQNADPLQSAGQAAPQA